MVEEGEIGGRENAKERSGSETEGSVRDREGKRESKKE